MSTLEEEIKVFDEKINSLSLSPYEYNGVFYLHEYNYSSLVNEEDIRILFNSDVHNCKFCIQRIIKFIKIADKKGPILLQFFKREEQIAAINKFCTGTIVPKILDTKLLFSCDKNIGGFPHIFFSSNYTNKIKNPKVIQSAIYIYIKDNLLENLIKNLLLCNDNDSKEVIKSLECFTVCCSNATYGETFIQTAKWLISIMEGYSKSSNNVNLFVQALIDAGIEKTIYGAVVTKFHQANANILSLLQNARSEEEMTTLIKDRLNPLNYRRRDSDAILSNGNINNAMKHLGDFENTIMTHTEVSKLPHCICLNSTMSLFNGMKTTKPQGKPQGSFASRCINVNNTTIDELYKYFENNPNSNVYINNSSDMHPIYIAKTTLDKDIINFPHLWAFDRSIKIKSGWIKVKYIIPMNKYIESHKNIAFILDTESILKKSDIKNCCFPAFLTPAYARTCDKAFERLNTVSKITIPQGDVAIGVGTSISNSKLVKSINIKINNVELTIRNA